MFVVCRSAHNLEKPYWTDACAESVVPYCYYANGIVQAVIYPCSDGFEASLAEDIGYPRLKIAVSSDLQYLRVLVETTVQLSAVAGSARRSVWRSES